MQSHLKKPIDKKNNKLENTLSLKRRNEDLPLKAMARVPLDNSRQTLSETTAQLKESPMDLQSQMFNESYGLQNGFLGTVQRAFDSEAQVGKETSGSEKQSDLVLPETGFMAIPDQCIARTGSEELKPLLDKVLKDYSQSVHYNSIEDAAEFVSHLTDSRKEGETSPQDAYNSFVPDSLSPLDDVHGAQCVGQGRHIAYLVHEKTGYYGLAVAARFGARVTYSHGAAIVKFQNPSDHEDAGYFLLDPGFNKFEPLLVTKSVKAKTGNYEYELSEDGSSIDSFSVGKSESDGESTRTPVASFPTQVVLNPESITKTALLTYKEFVIVAQRGSKKRAVLQLNLRNNIITIRNEENVKKERVKTFSLDRFSDIQGALDKDFCEKLGYRKELLEEKIKMIIDHQLEILDLQKSAEDNQL